MSFAEAAGSPAPITIGEKKYTATPLNLVDLGAIEETVRAIVLNAAVRAAESLPTALGDRLIDRALSKIISITFEHPDFTAYLRTFAGICDLICTSLRAKHPDVTPALIAPILRERTDQYEAAALTVMRISALNRKGEEPKPGEAEGAAEAA
jgi:hypothetical protein